MRETDLGRKIVIAIILLAVVITAIYTVKRWTGGKEEALPGIQAVAEETRSVTLYFAGRDADGLVTETREIPVGEGVEREVKAVMAALISGPKDEDAISAIPAGTSIHEVFWVEDTETLYLDFNRGITTGDGSTGEYYTITTIIRTIGANFPQAGRLQFLVEGYPVETLAGHYGVNKPLNIRKWR
ncbi:MAG: GerMN domain-containing protein [Candidatus Krumholzibacteria bacterium]|nr:GerMN domain-containing protein [Candidatus Krumholzibacteria bacterium]